MAGKFWAEKVSFEKLKQYENILLVVYADIKQTIGMQAKLIAPYISAYIATVLYLKIASGDLDLEELEKAIDEELERFFNKLIETVQKIIALTKENYISYIKNLARDLLLEQLKEDGIIGAQG